MQKPIYFMGACALVAAATIAWWQGALVASRVNTAAASLLPRALSLAETATTAAVSPTEMMVNYNRPLPVEHWDTPSP